MRLSEDLGVSLGRCGSGTRIAKSRKQGQAEAAKYQDEATPEHKLARLERANAALYEQNVSLRVDREILKSSSLLREGERMTFAFIAAEVFQ